MLPNYSGNINFRLFQFSSSIFKFHYKDPTLYIALFRLARALYLPQMRNLNLFLKKCNSRNPCTELMCHLGGLLLGSAGVFETLDERCRCSRVGSCSWVSLEDAADDTVGSQALTTRATEPGRRSDGFHSSVEVPAQLCRDFAGLESKLIFPVAPLLVLLPEKMQLNLSAEPPFSPAFPGQPQPLPTAPTGESFLPNKNFVHGPGSFCSENTQ